MAICVINISDEADCVLSEITYEEQSTTAPLARLLAYFAKNNVHFISVSAQEDDAVVTLCWDKFDWEQHCERAVNPSYEAIRDHAMMEEHPSDNVVVPPTSP
ncbi:uncharacterized protein L201_001039 [Kwoniella dendrophila CBS 6074]|uniref:Uncharacterized protein n=1 Tax=Kwoniella dendrophila CBS 6074 TaxID=1295534 RepID=A0AAX4JMC5_9TREE